MPLFDWFGHGPKANFDFWKRPDARCFRLEFLCRGQTRVIPFNEYLFCFT